MPIYKVVSQEVLGTYLKSKCFSNNNSGTLGVVVKNATKEMGYSSVSYWKLYFILKDEYVVGETNEWC